MCQRKNDVLGGEGRGHHHKAVMWHDIWFERIREEYADKLTWFTVGLAVGLAVGIGLGRETKRE